MMSTYDIRELLTEILLYNASLVSQRKMKGGKSVPLSECSVTNGSLQQMLDEIQTQCN